VTEATAGTALRVRAWRDSDREAWDRFVLAHPEGTLFHLSAWKRLVEGTYPFDPEYLLAEAGGEVVGVLPLFRVRNVLFGDALLSVPFAVYGGVVARERAPREALLRAAEERLRALDADLLELRQEHDLGLPHPGTDLYVTFRKRLPERVEDVLAGLPRKTRAAARKGRDGFQLETVVSLDNLDRFVHLFLLNKRHLGSPAFGPRFFRKVVEEFGRSVLLLTVLHGGRAVAAVLCFAFRETLVPYFSGALEETEPLRINNYMYLRLMEIAVERGFKEFDFGRSRRGSGAYKFKEYHGFEATALHYRYVLRKARSIPSANPSNPRFDCVRRLWSRVPVPIARVAGPFLMRYFP